MKKTVRDVFLGFGIYFLATLIIRNLRAAGDVVRMKRAEKEEAAREAALRSA